jgi:hypothetical protein
MHGQTIYLVVRRETDVCECAGVFLTEEGARVAADRIVRHAPPDNDAQAEVIPFEVNRLYSELESGRLKLLEPPRLVAFQHVTKIEEIP